MKLEPIIYDDYTGPRWTYGLTYRPPTWANIPAGAIVFSNREHPDFRFGTIDYPFQLDEHTTFQADLTLVKEF